MDIKKYMKIEGEKPLDHIVQNGGFCGIFRTICCIGDSLSSGEHESRINGENGFHDYYDYSWGQFLARDAGCTVYNFSKGGMHARKYDEFATERGFYDEKYKSQAYILALGVNDVSKIMNGDWVLGNITDINPADPAQNKDSFAGCYGKIISKYKEIEPRAKFFLMTMPRDCRLPAREEMNDRHAALLHEIADLFENCYVLDFRKYAPIYDEEFRKNFYLAGHMNAAGYRLTALMVESYIDYIVRNNPDDFRQIGFVGTPFYNENEKR